MIHRSLSRKFSLCFFVLLLGLIVAFSINGLALTVQTGSFKIDLSGEKTWSVKFGLGDGASLSQVGYPKDSYSLSQSLRVKLDGQLGKNFSLNADLDDSNPGYLQQFGIKMDTDNWDGLLGDSVAGGGDNFTVYNKKLLGLQLSGNLDGTELEAVAGQLQGVSETKIFYGNTAKSEVEYSLYKTDAQLEETGYSKNIRGLEYYGLDVEYVEGFTEPELTFTGTDSFWSFLEEWEIGYLQKEITDEPKEKLSSGQFKVVSNQRDNLILLEERFSLLRGRIKDYISLYNEGLTEEEKKEYPFNPGTDYEEKFLSALQDYVSLNVGDQSLDLESYERRRFYSLGRSGIEQEDFQLEVKIDGNWQSVDGLSGYSYQLFNEKGLIELDFPEKFFDTGLADRRIRATFKYKISGKTYMLGFSVAPNSEKVYLNGNLLTKNTDYSIDYETGALILFREVGPDDKIKVDFERARGGLGGFAQYGRVLYGFSTRMKSDYGLVLDVSLFQARDMAPSELSPEVSTMPNVHTVGGISASYKENGWNASFKLGGNVNQFPFDDNKRVKLPNRITKILSLAESGYEITLFAHKNGFTVKKSENGNEVWESYDTKDGLAGKDVNDGLIVDGLLFLGANTGLTKVELAGSAPFGRATNWQSFYESDGLPEPKVLSLASDGEIIWLGTESGVVRGEIGKLKDGTSWEVITPDSIKDIPITEITHLGEKLWLGTKDGLYRYNLKKGELVGKLPELSARVHDLEVSNGVLYVASTDGIAKVKTDSPEWLLEDQSVNSISVSGSEIWYSTDNGFSRLGSSELYGNRKVTAVLGTGSRVWAGSEGYRVDGTGELTVYRLAEELRKYLTEKTKIDGLDENRYASIDPARHTDRGISLTAGASRTFGVWGRDISLSTGLNYVQPTYTPIGKQNRNDRLAAEVGLAAQLAKGLSLDLSSNYSLSALTTDASEWSVSNQVAVDWSTIVDTSTAFSWTRKKGGQTELGMNLGLSKDFWEGGLSTAFDLGLNRDIGSDGGTSDYGTIAANVTLSPWDSTNFGVNYLYPLAFGSLKRKKNEKLGWNFGYSRDLGLVNDYGLSFQLSGKGQAKSLLVPGKLSWQNKLTLKSDFNELTFRAIGLSPSLSLGWNTSDSGNEITGKLSASGSFNPLSTRVSLSRKVNMPSGSKLVKYEDKLQGNISYELPDLTPVLDYRLSRNLLTHPVQGRKEKYSGDLTLGTEWSPWSRVTNEIEAGAGYSSDKGLSYLLTDNLDWKINSKLSPEASFELNYVPGSGKLGLSTKTSFSYPFRNRWGVSFTSGFNWGLNDSGEFYSSFFGSTGLKVEF